MKYAFGKAASAAQKEPGTSTSIAYRYLPEPGPDGWTRFELLVARQKWLAKQARADAETDD